MKDYPKVERNGKVAVILSKEAGHGFSTQEPDHPSLVFDPKVVELIEEGGTNEELFFYLNDTYVDWIWSRIEGLKIYWIPKGTKFLVVDESDVGIETLYTEDQMFIA